MKFAALLCCVMVMGGLWQGQKTYRAKEIFHLCGRIGPAADYFPCNLPEDDLNAPPFDVPPVERVTYDPPMPKNWEKLIDTGRSCVGPLSANENRGQLCLDGVVHDIYYTRTCKDESRYLLERSDSTWHCLALSQVPR